MSNKLVINHDLVVAGSAQTHLPIINASGTTHILDANDADAWYIFAGHATECTLTIPRESVFGGQIFPIGTEIWFMNKDNAAMTCSKENSGTFLLHNSSSVDEVYFNPYQVGYIKKIDGPTFPATWVLWKGN